MQSGFRPELIAIGVSTGGPNALMSILPRLPEDFPLPIVIVQHMPAIFTRAFAKRLDQAMGIKVVEANDGDSIQPAHVYLAPGDFHMQVRRVGHQYLIKLTQTEAVNFCRPSVDVLFKSFDKLLAANTLAVVLTGMGNDGLQGCQALRDQGAMVFAQDEASSAVWGMPGAVIKAGLADKIISPLQVAEELNKLVYANKRVG